MGRKFSAASNGATWSASRGQMLRSCERKYFFQYLCDARLSSEDPQLRGIAMLKKLKSLAMWQGDCVHEAIAGFLTRARMRQAPEADLVCRGVAERMRRDWDFSEKRRFREEPTSIGRAGTALFEHEYDEVPPDISVDELIGEARAMLQNFFSWVDHTSGFLQELSDARRVWIEPPAWGAEAPGFREGDVQVITKVDLALHSRSGAFTVFDWKTGQLPRPGGSASQNEIQVNVYMLWAHLGLNLPVDRIASRLVYLGGATPNEARFNLDEERALGTRQLIADSVEQAQRWETYIRTGRMELGDLDFASSVGECRLCNFKRVCRAALSTKELQ